jgi:putative transposase
VLKGAGLLDCWKAEAVVYRQRLVQPLSPHEHWHVDVSNVNISATFF